MNELRQENRELKSYVKSKLHSSTIATSSRRKDGATSLSRKGGRDADKSYSKRGASTSKVADPPSATKSSKSYGAVSTNTSKHQS